MSANEGGPGVGRGNDGIYKLLDRVLLPLQRHHSASTPDLWSQRCRDHPTHPYLPIRFASHIARAVTWLLGRQNGLGKGAAAGSDVCYVALKFRSFVTADALLLKKAVPEAKVESERQKRKTSSLPEPHIFSPTRRTLHRHVPLA